MTYEVEYKCVPGPLGDDPAIPTLYCRYRKPGGAWKTVCVTADQPAIDYHWVYYDKDPYKMSVVERLKYFMSVVYGDCGGDFDSYVREFMEIVIERGLYEETERISAEQFIASILTPKWKPINVDVG